MAGLMRRVVARGLVMMAVALLAMPALAASKEKKEEEQGVQYIDLKPPFVTNYGSAGANRFLKADISLRVEDGTAASAVSHHMPQLRHVLVMLLSRQEASALASMEGKEQLRQEALTAVREVLEREEGRAGVQDLLFTGFILQR